MINIKTPAEIEYMRIANGIVRDLLLYMEEIVKEGVTTAYLDEKARAFIEKRGAKPSFLGYEGFPGSLPIFHEASSAPHSSRISFTPTPASVAISSLYPLIEKELRLN